MASSSAHQQQQQQKLPTTTSYGGATTAPPPTPSTTGPNNIHNHNLSTTSAADALSHLLLTRLSPSLSLSLPTRLRHSTHNSTRPISLSDPNITDLLLSSASQLGFFQLTDHSIPPELAHSAESESNSLFQLSRDKKESYFPKNWPLGFHLDDDETESFCLDGTESPNELELSSVRELTRALEKMGLKMIELIAKAVGFENPLGKGEDPTRLMWVHESYSHEDNNNPVISGGFYPYIVGLHYQIKSQKYSLLVDSGWVSVSPQVDSVLVTVGDITQVWSNGKLNKVRGRPVASLTDKEKTGNHNYKMMSLLLTLPLDNDLSISPLLPRCVKQEGNDENGRSSEEEEIEMKFNSFSFEDYAWRVYNDPCLHFKDPLNRYRISD